MTECYSMMVFLNFNLGHLNLIWATNSCPPLGHMSHPLLKLNDLPAFHCMKHFPHGKTALIREDKSLRSPAILFQH